ncbi:MAG: PHP domain-containing protein [Candidatus Methanomethyliaceae archaeon]|nr:PHP domain-containing protein [Candidatus Methanomethyliaceae archaeon]
MKLKLDLHVHTNASEDGVSTVYDVIRSSKKKGLDGIAITDHDIPLTEERAAKMSQDNDILLIPGVEVSTDAGHLIILNPRQNFPVDSPFLETVKSALSEGSILIIPHPTDPLSHGIGEKAIRSTLSFSLPLEVMNASTLNRYNKSARKLAKLLALPVVGGSDAHIETAVGDAYTVVETQTRSVEAILKGIKNGKTSAYGTETSIVNKLEMTWKRLSKRTKLRKAPDEIQS